MDGGTATDPPPLRPVSPPIDDITPHAPSATHDAAANLEPDTCRICRGEATPQEPLFYPCKCSGSIKYVHQDCLMEWLSHSQKKHCELCKTSFRFTKLYSPTMPRQVPVFLFGKHLAKYFVRNILVWLRVALVFTVWAVILPILTRWEWSFFFWVSEEGLVVPSRVLARDASAVAASNSTAGNASSLLPALVSSLASAATDINSSLASALDTQGAADGADALQGANASSSSSAPSLLTVAASTFLDIIGVSDLAAGAAAGNQTASTGLAGTVPPTLLSEVSFLNNLTRFRTLNYLVTYTLEGLFITFLVIVCFILIILVRDYVVQQQPDINMRAAFGDDADIDAAADNNILVGPVEAPRRGAVNRHHHHHHHHHHHQHEAIVGGHGHELFDDSDWETDESVVSGDLGDHEEHQQALAGEGHQFNFDVDVDVDVDDEEPVPESADGGVDGVDADVPASLNTPAPSADTVPDPSDDHIEVGPSSTAGDDDHSEAFAVGTYPDDGSSLPAHLRHLDSMSQRPTAGGASVNEYMAIFRRAGGDPNRILEIARAEGLEDHLQYWLRVMQNVAERRQSDRGSMDSNSSTTTVDSAEVPDYAQQLAATAPSVAAARSALASEVASWSFNSDGRSQPKEGSSNSSSSKGKERAATPPPADESERDATASPIASPSTKASTKASHSFGDFEYGLRPRANTDGPIPALGTNPLGSNNWSFPPAKPVEETQWDEYRDETRDPASDPFAQSAVPGNDVVSDSSDITFDEELLQATDATLEADEDLPAHAPEDAPAANETALRPVDVRPQQHHQHHHQPAPPGSLLDAAANFMWRDLDNIDPDDLPPLPVIEDDDAHVALFEEQDEPLPRDEAEREAFEAAAAAAAAANMEAEAIEDAEDLEGVLELLGMRGPILGLFQNVMFCEFLVTVSLLIGVFLPYNVGRLSIWLMANPMQPVMMLFSLSKLLQDAVAAILGAVAYGTVLLLQPPIAFLQAQGWTTPASFITSSLETTWVILTTAMVRVGENFNFDAMFMPTGEIRNFSAISHEALFTLKAQLAVAAAGVGRVIAMTASGDVLTLGTEAMDITSTLSGAAWALLKKLPAVLSDPSSWVITLGPIELSSVNPEFAYWGGQDRFLAISMGYSTVFILAWWYLNKAAPFTTGGQAGDNWETAVIEALKQAGGVLKVTLIIGIEMLVFPLYCGLLLDIALMPLFQNTTVMSRLMFGLNYPVTSMFVHWFVGTGYMFHFALFVSMCRKIIRKGVLYFIRDPDDPEFHPVRDVLDRSVTTQLRKILFSAFVYGALVIVCLGSTVWGLAYAGLGVLPIHHSSNEPVLEFPIDLLFYNFLMPLAIKFFRPGDALHSMYTWWFRKSGRVLRMTWFLFGDRQVDEEGVLVLRPDSPYQKYPWVARMFLAYDSHSKTVHPTVATVARADDIYYDTDDTDDEEAMAQQIHKDDLVESQQLIPDGDFVRAPASDQVRVPKGKHVFVPVTEDGHRLDANDSAQDMYNSEQYQIVYIPPHFRVRLFLFIVSIWLFAACTGVSLTIVPLIFGRALFRSILPPGVETNDIYAFSIGMYVLSAAGYIVFHVRSVIRSARSLVGRSASSAASTVDAAKASVQAVVRIAKIVYSYFFILGVFPLLASGLLELYVQIPLHTYMYPPTPLSAADSVGEAAGPDPSRHTIYLVQSWTLGLLFLKVATRSIASMYPDSRLASAMRAVLRRGGLDPDARLLTRAFIVPGALLTTVAVCLPWTVSTLFLSWRGKSELLGGLLHFFAYVPVPSLDDPRIVHRFSYPFTAVLVAMLRTLWGMLGLFTLWKIRIRDEVYLIGERLHNYGAANATPAARRGQRASVRA